jgi:hypothetical protein
VSAIDPARAIRAAAQIAAHGPGPTFGDLAIGDAFHWPFARGPEPMIKTSDTRYAWSRGYGTAEPYYRVEPTNPPAQEPA